jgi:phosphorylase kinase alpha/beta subunit
MIGEKLNSNKRLDNEATLSQMTSSEQSFKLLVNHLLNKIQAPVYRQLTVENSKDDSFYFSQQFIIVYRRYIIDGYNYRPCSKNLLAPLSPGA